MRKNEIPFWTWLFYIKTKMKSIIDECGHVETKKNIILGKFILTYLEEQ